MKKIVVCVSITDELQMEELKHLKEYAIFESAEVHFVNVFKAGTYINELSLYNFPAPEQYDDIEAGVTQILKTFANELLGSEACGRAQFKCLFHSSPKQKIIEYLKEVQADLVVSAVRSNHGIEGLFLSSFTDYLCKLSPCDIWVVRPRTA